MHLMVEHQAPPSRPAEKLSDDADLLAGLRRRDTGALAALVDRYSRSLARAAYLILGDADAAQDAVQETFIVAWDKIGRVHDGAALRPWLYGVLNNMCRRRLRKRVFVERWEKTAGERQMRESGGNAGLVEAPLESMREALKRLAPEERTIIVLRFERELSVAETAAALGLPEGTVKSRTHSAIQELRRILGVL